MLLKQEGAPIWDPCSVPLILGKRKNEPYFILRYLTSPKDQPIQGSFRFIHATLNKNSSFSI
jgi:hypothetical protein